MQPRIIGRNLMRSIGSVFSRRCWTVSTEKEDRFIVLTDETNRLDSTQLGAKTKRLIFPSIWLRDNCQCPRCFDTQANSRTIDMMHFDWKVKPEQAQISAAQQLKVAWSDGHHSDFSLEWLKERSFDPDTQNAYLRRNYKFERKPWSARSFPEIFKKYDYRAIIEDDRVLLDWLTHLITYGVALIENSGVELGTIKILARRVAFLRRTQYGETFYVEAKEGATNSAYKAAALQLHVDLPYNRYMPEILFLHCILQSKQKEGGESHLTDCLHVGQEMKASHPKMYDILRSVEVDWSDIGEDSGYEFHAIHREPVVCENKDGEIRRVNFSQPQRDNHFNIPAEDVDSWYEAWSLFVQQVHNSENRALFRLTEGDILVFDNTRLVHGRTAFNDSRILEGGYMDWDLAHSRMRILRKQLHVE
nr:PREDICTED: gamma-butyrobetaine dioxygenase isoform X2 [Bemisia tabaci]